MVYKQQKLKKKHLLFTIETSSVDLICKLNKLLSF